LAYYSTEYTQTALINLHYNDNNNWAKCVISL